MTCIGKQANFQTRHAHQPRTPRGNDFLPTKGDFSLPDAGHAGINILLSPFLVQEKRFRLKKNRDQATLAQKTHTPFFQNWAEVTSMIVIPKKLEMTFTCACTPTAWLRVMIYAVSII